MPSTLISRADRGSTVVKALGYKSEGRWFEKKKKIPDGVIVIFH